MSDLTARDEKLVEVLNQAYGKEKQLETALETNLQVTSRADYEKRLKQHLKETKSHATSVARRIKQLGGTAETVSLPGPESAVKAAQTVQGVVGKAKAAAQGPMHMARGEGEQAKMLHNARLQYRDEAEEIATYTVIDALATSVGDKQTAKLARGIRGEEERMALFLADLLPELATDVAHDEIPVSEIEGDAARRNAADARTPSRGSRSSKSPAKKSSAKKSSARAGRSAASKSKSAKRR